VESAEQVLLTILAATDAAWLPMRTWTPPVPANTYFARRDFSRQGVPWVSGAASEADRKEAQRLVETLAGQGVVQLFRPRRLKTLGVRLTDEGEGLARRLCGLPGLEIARSALAEVVRLSSERQKGCVSEAALAGVAWSHPRSGKILARLEDQVLPGLIRGWLESNADIIGHVYYRATDIGRRAAIESPAGEWSRVSPQNEAPRDDGAKERYGFYLERLDAALARLRTAEPQDQREIGLLPLPASMGGQAVFLADVAPVGAPGAAGGPGTQPAAELAPGAQRGANGA
jgi:hypothetical protein